MSLDSVIDRSIYDRTRRNHGYKVSPCFLVSNGVNGRLLSYTHLHPDFSHPLHHQSNLPTTASQAHLWKYHWYIIYIYFWLSDRVDLPPVSGILILPRSLFVIKHFYLPMHSASHSVYWQLQVGMKVVSGEVKKCQTTQAIGLVWGIISRSHLDLSLYHTIPPVICIKLRKAWLVCHPSCCRFVAKLAAP